MSGASTKGKNGEIDESYWQNLDNYRNWVIGTLGFVILFSPVWNFFPL